ncbi:(2Fe-2S)-binding protein [Hylemonella gracilis]|uniref:Bacterioferritin-associated ferredoxin n=1 Tax=Hylemonella gracilis ATCC 19624 TaxID=887062 RepID=F3KTE8_9BURK|nr:(2Fe-2S)-binding protein [Hylemonella gracilis]EGI76827.1 BFD/(2Fe-2S)-binding domain-containing protein [Hylemonella gracilis ATCC 19624]
MIVCVCHRVSDHTIAHAARSGAEFDDIQLELGVATQCGKCEDCARALWSQCRPSHKLAHLSQALQMPGAQQPVTWMAAA